MGSLEPMVVAASVATLLPLLLYLSLLPPSVLLSPWLSLLLLLLQSLPLPLLLHVLVPSALPTIMVGIRLAFAASWAAIVAAELIGAPSGLGFAIEWYRQLLMTPKVFAFILAIGVVGYLCDLGLRALQKKLTPWTEGSGNMP